MMRNPIVLLHGYSDSGPSFQPWVNILNEEGYDVRTIHNASYTTLTNEVTIRDIAEGFDRALRIRAGLHQDEPFDAIVHSTGMLVIRSWLTAYAGKGLRRNRLKRLIGLAPASFGSPLAHKGRSWLGAIFKGSKEIGGPDFLEQGNRVLDGLELASRFTWDLAGLDLLGTEPFYGEGADTPYVFTLCGTEGYSGLRALASEPGTDGTVRLAGCALNTRKIRLDLTQDPNLLEFEPWSNVDIPLVPVAGLNHGTIVSKPNEELQRLVKGALKVSSWPEFQEWNLDALASSRRMTSGLARWQQFVVRACDERNDPIEDYNLKLCTERNGTLEELESFDVDVHAYSGDKSFRSFHVNLDKLEDAKLQNLHLQIIVSSGSQLVGYTASTGAPAAADNGDIDTWGWWSGQLDCSHLLRSNEVTFFYPYTTTLVEIVLNREPLPLDRGVENRIFKFLAEQP